MVGLSGDDQSFLRYTTAIVSRIPHNVQLDNEIAQKGIDLQKARSQHDTLLEALRIAGVDVIELAPEDSAPIDSIFLDDYAVVNNGIALLTTPSGKFTPRRAEITALFIELGLKVREVDNDGKVLLNGSDVIFTGREFFVGVGKYTNEAGAQVVAATFPEFSVIPIKVDGDVTLKSRLSVGGPNVLVVVNTKEGSALIKRIEREATFRYVTLTMAEGDDDAANCLSVNNTLIYSDEFPNSLSKFESLESIRKAPIQLSELRKMCGMMSQHAILFRRTKIMTVNVAKSV